MAHEVITYELPEEAGIYQLCRAADLPLKGDLLHVALRRAVLQSIDEKWCGMLATQEALIARWSRLKPKPLPEAELMREARERAEKMTPGVLAKRCRRRNLTQTGPGTG
jgi:hypothetical protein